MKAIRIFGIIITICLLSGCANRYDDNLFKEILDSLEGLKRDNETLSFQVEELRRDYQALIAELTSAPTETTTPMPTKTPKPTATPRPTSIPTPTTTPTPTNVPIKEISVIKSNKNFEYKKWDTVDIVDTDSGIEIDTFLSRDDQVYVVMYNNTHRQAYADNVKIEYYDGKGNHLPYDNYISSYGADAYSVSLCRGKLFEEGYEWDERKTFLSNLSWKDSYGDDLLPRVRILSEEYQNGLMRIKLQNPNDHSLRKSVIFLSFDSDGYISEATMQTIDIYSPGGYTDISYRMPNNATEYMIIFCGCEILR